jgi:cobalt-zinc-cadmium resistance protein CzcA
MPTDTEPRDLVAQVIAASFARPLLVALGVILGVVLGYDAFRGLDRDVFPDLSTPIFSVIVQNAAMGSEELEAAIAVPMETALAGLPDVRRVRSTNQLGVSQVVIEFEPDADVLRARQAIVERVTQVELPDGTEPPLISSLTGRLNEIVEFTLEADPGTADLTTLRDLAEFEVKNRLVAVPGVAAVERLGGYLREVQVQMDPDRMSARGVTLDQVMHAAEGSNRNAAGGLVVDGDTEWAVRAVGQVRAIDDVRSTVVAVQGDVPVLLGEVADVVEAPAVRRGIAHRLSGEVVSCRVSKQFGSDTVTVARGIRAAIAEIEPTRPTACTCAWSTTRPSSSTPRSAGWAARSRSVVVLVIFGLLGDVRAAALVTVTIPLSLALAAVGLDVAGVGLNTMTLGGLAIAVGLLVDASIIVCENVVHRLSLDPSRDRWAAAAAASAEVGRPIAFATVIVVAVFLPLFALDGVEGRMVRPLAGAVIAAMTASLVLAVTFTPVASGLLLRAARGTNADNALIRAVKWVYAPVLDLSLRFPALVVAVSVAVALPTLVCAGFVGRDFMPELDEGALLVQTFLPAEASLDTVDRLNHRVEDELRQVPEVIEVVRRTGRAERTEDPMPHTVSDVLVVLDPDRRRSNAAIEDEVRDRLAGVLGVNAAITTPLGMRIDEGLGGTPADISVRIFGPDLDQLARLAREVEGRLAGVDGVADLRAEQLTGLPQVRVEVDRAAAARVGLTPGDVVDALRIGLVGETVSELRVGQRRVDLVVKLRPDRRDSVEGIRSLLVDGHDGTRIPLGKLARIESTTGPGAIKREAGSRRIAVEMAVVGRDLGSTADDVEEALRGLDLPTGTFWDVGGRVESQARASEALLTAIGLALVAVVVLLYLALDAALETAVILATLPLALVGGVVGLVAFGETWNVSSMVGLIGLFGIAVQNGLVLVTQIRALRAEGYELTAAVREASLGRVRPKLMTAGTAILGMMPMLVLDLHGTEIERPLAVVMVCGLVSSTMFTLLALPAFYRVAVGAVERWGPGRDVA